MAMRGQKLLQAKRKRSEGAVELMTLDQAYADPAVRKAVEDAPFRNGPSTTFEAARLAQRAGLKVQAEVIWLDDEPIVSWSVTVPPKVEGKIAAMSWIDSEGNLDYTATRSTRPGVGWQLTSWARDGDPWGHSDLSTLADAFDTRPMSAGVSMDGLAQVVMKDGRILDRGSLSNPTAREVRKALRDAGCHELRQKGSHVQVQCPGGRTTVPVHGSKDIKRGTLRSIERSVGIDVDGDGRPVGTRARRLANRLSNP